MSKVKRYTDAQLSRALSHAHELIQGGSARYFLSPWGNVCGCVNQVAYNVELPGEAWSKNKPVAEVFDNKWPLIKHTPDSLLRLLEKVGAA